MNTKLLYYGKVENGKIVLPSKRFKQEVTQAFEGKAIQMVVERKKKRRSPEQNKYYWGVVVTILVHSFKEWNPDMLITPALVHEWAKDRFLPLITDLNIEKIDTPEGEKEIRLTTTELTTAQFMDYIVLIQ
jgi:hypothetical protein